MRPGKDSGAGATIRTILVGSALVAVGVSAAGSAAGAAGADVLAPAGRSAAELRTEPSAATPADWGLLHLRRALFYLERQDLQGALAEAERAPLDPTTNPLADRAVCLLAWGYERLGDDASLARVADVVSAWPPTPFTEWVREADVRRRLRVGSGGGSEARIDPSRELSGLADFEPGSGFADAWVELAELLADLEAAEAAAGPVTAGELALEAWLADHPDHPLTVPVELRLGSLALASGAYESAAARFGGAAADLARRSERLEGLRSPERLDEVWSDWERGGGFDRVRVLSLEDGSIATDLRGWLPGLLDPRREAVELPARPLREATGPASLSRLVPLAPLDSLHRVTTLESAARSAFTERERARWRLQQARAELEARREFLDRGRMAAEGSAEELRLLAAEIARLEADLERILARIDLVSEMEIARIVGEAERIRRRAEESLLRIGAARQFYEEGPDSLRRTPPPPGHPSAGQLLDQGESHARSLAVTAERFGTVLPEDIRRSRDEIWKPALRARVGTLAAEVARLLALAEETSDAIRARLAALESGDPLARFHEEIRLHDAEVALRVEAWTEGRRAVVNAALDAEAARLTGFTEGVDYGVALASYELAIRERGDGDEARAAWGQFLERHPQASTRADALYRLADLELTLAKREFQEQMAAYLDLPEDTRSRTVVPILESGRSRELYEEIVLRHPDFSHLDAALYHVGVLRADEGEEAGVTALARLVAEYPTSPFRQEAELRMADFRFDEGRLEEAVDLYAAAGSGPDPGLGVVALYKLGWTHYRRDRFDEAASAFAQVLDLYAEGAEAPIAKDLRGESTDYLVHSLARGGGGPAASRLFDHIGARTYEADVFASVGILLRRYSLFPEAAESDRLWLDRYPTDPRALLIAGGQVEAYEASERPELARQARLELAERFLPGTPWFQANGADSLRHAAAEFSRDALHDVALFHHHRAREMDASTAAASTSQEEWERALALYDRILALWPEDERAARVHYQIGEAAARSGKRARAHDAFLLASQADEAFAADAAWQSLVVLDAWYEDVESDSLARLFLDEADAYRTRDPYDSRGPDLAWRQAGVAFARGWDEEAANRYADFAQRYPQEGRSPRALALRGDVFYRGTDYAGAAVAYADAERVARSARQDSLATELAVLVPHSRYLHAESLQGTAAASAFEEVARGWPEFAEAENALYRAGVGYAESGEVLGATRCFEELLRRHPEGEYARDAHLQLAATLEDAGRPADAARVQERFSLAFPDDPESGPALLHAADLWRQDGNEPAADATERAYVERFPEDRKTAAAIFHRGASRDLERLGQIDAFSPGIRPGTLAPLLGAESDLARYVAIANADSTLADPDLLARLAFLEAEERRVAYDAMRLTQPLAACLERKKAALEAVVAGYGTVVKRGISPWSQAATFRIGECLIGFGDRLRESERPADLSGDDLLAYDEVLEEQAWTFYGQGEGTWEELLRRVDPALGDEGRWLERTQGSLWPRVAERFVHLSEADHPVVAAVRPEEGEK